MEMKWNGRAYWSATDRVWFIKFKRDGRWHQKQVPVSAASEPQALQWASSWIEQQRLSIIASGPATIRSVAPRWLEWKKELATKRDHADCERVLRLWVFPHALADADLDRLELPQTTAWIEWLKTKGRAPNTVRNIVQCVRSMMTDLRGKGWVSPRPSPLDDPWTKRQLRGTERLAGKHTIIHLDATQLAVLLASEAPPHHRRARNAFAAGTGLRSGELAALAWSHLELDAAVPNVNVLRQLADRGFKPPKGGAPRRVPLHPRLVATLLKWKGTTWGGTDGGDPVFPTESGGFGRGRWSADLRIDLACCGLPIDYPGSGEERWPMTFHCLRRTFLTLLNEAGVSEQMIAALAGHGSKTVTDKHYVARSLGRYMEAILKLPIS